MNKINAARKKANWLSYCLEIGWDKDHLDKLGEIWDGYYDENGNRRPAQPADIEGTPEKKKRFFIEDVAALFGMYKNKEITIGKLTELLNEKVEAIEGKTQEGIPDLKNNEYLDLTTANLSEEDKANFIKEVAFGCGTELLKTFLGFALKTHIEQMITNDVDGKEYVLTFQTYEMFLKRFLPLQPEEKTEGNKELFEWVKETPVSGISLIIRYKKVIQFCSYTFEDNGYSCDYAEGVIIKDCENVEWLKPIPNPAALKPIKEKISEADIMKIMVANKYKTPINKGDLAIWMVDIEKSAKAIRDILNNKIIK